MLDVTSGNQGLLEDHEQYGQIFRGNKEMAPNLYCISFNKKDSSLGGSQYACRDPGGKVEVSELLGLDPDKQIRAKGGGSSTAARTSDAGLDEKKDSMHQQRFRTAR